MSAERDFELAGRADQIAAALAGSGRPDAPPHTFSVDLEAREAVLRFRDLTFGLMTFALEYGPDMPESALRAWAAAVNAALRGE